MKKIIVLLCIFLSCFLVSKAREYHLPPEGCLRVFTNPSAEAEKCFSNPDSIMVDSCAIAEFNYPFLIEDYCYGYGNFSVGFDVNIIPRKTDKSGNSTLTYSIEDILPQYKSIIADFKSLSNYYGNFHFIDSRLNLPDTTKLCKRVLQIRFDSIVPISKVRSFIRDINFINTVTFDNWFHYLAYIPNDIGMKPGTKISQIGVYNTNDKKFPPNYTPNGFQWEKYVTKLPLSWELSRGKSNVVIADLDVQPNKINYCREDTHPELNNNFITISNSDGNIGDGIEETDILRDNHGLITISCAIADDNNGAPLVGSCPDCNGLLLKTVYVDPDYNPANDPNYDPAKDPCGVGPLSYYPSNYSNLDVDGIRNNIVTKYPIRYSAITGQGYDGIDLINNGCVLLGAMGNSLKAGFGSQIYINGEEFRFPTPLTGFQITPFTNSNSLSNQSLYTQPITVAALKPGEEMYDNNCNVAGNRYSNLLFLNYKGKPTFETVLSTEVYGEMFNFSPDTTKFTPVFDSIFLKMI